MGVGTAAGGAGAHLVNPSLLLRYGRQTQDTVHEMGERGRRETYTLSMIDTLVYALFRVFSCVMARVSFRVAMPVAS